MNHHQRLHAGLAQLKSGHRKLFRPDPERPVVGCELEGFFVERATGRVMQISPSVLSQLPPGVAAYELGRSQFELNPSASPLPAARELWKRELKVRTALLAAAAANAGAELLFTGIPRELVPANLVSEALYPVPRMGLLDTAWKSAWDTFRTTPGNQFLGTFEPTSVAVSTAMASTQFHLQLPLCEREAGEVYNIIAAVSPLVLAAFCNSGRFLGREDYAEYRVPIWEMLDDAGRGRVFYGPGYVTSIFEVLDHYVEEIPFLHLGEDLDALDDLGMLRRHVKNMWPWLRFIPDVDHWRLEVRLFPSVAPDDVLLMAELFYGLVLGLREQLAGELIATKVPFTALQENLAAIAKTGIEARVTWFEGRRCTARDLLLDLLPVVTGASESFGWNRPPSTQALKEKLLQ